MVSKLLSSGILFRAGSPSTSAASGRAGRRENFAKISSYTFLLMR
jgi:hypothetical protein